jgi:hypothetical protein
MSISDGAVEAAREAVRAAMIEFGPDGHTDGDEEITRAALEAAAPDLMAAAWDEGAEAQATRYLMEKDAGPNPYRAAGAGED